MALIVMIPYREYELLCVYDDSTSYPTVMLYAGADITDL